MTTFLLCIGCQKGGTTWLSEYLRGYPEVRLGARKEMHVLDSHFVPVNRDWHKLRIDRREAQLARVRAAGGEPRLTAQLAAEIAAYREAEALVPDLDSYAAYFRRIADMAPRARLVADVTPDYALLRAEDEGEQMSLL